MSEGAAYGAHRARIGELVHNPASCVLVGVRGRLAENARPVTAQHWDICLMRRDRRTVYRSGDIQFANLTYLGEHLAAYAGESVIIRYDPRDITTIFIYICQLPHGVTIRLESLLNEIHSI